MICIKCGREHSEDCLICENCGSPVNEELPQKEAVDQPSNQQAYPGFLLSFSFVQIFAIFTGKITVFRTLGKHNG
jgi:uncharacterized membrane protein YvbJ